MQEFLDARSAKFGTLQRLAKDMDVTFSGFLRGVKQGTLSAENCLRLAEVLGEDPAVIFRVANKPKLADQFERLYGRTTNPMTAAERNLVDRWRALTTTARAGFQILLHEIGPADVSESRTASAERAAPAQIGDGSHIAPLRDSGQEDAVPGAAYLHDRQLSAEVGRLVREAEAQQPRLARSPKPARVVRKPVAADRGPKTGRRPRAPKSRG